MNESTMNLSDLPDEILHNIFTYTADSPSYVGPCICYQLRPLSKKWRDDLDNERGNLWSLATGNLSLDYWPRGGSGSASKDDDAALQESGGSRRPTKRARNTTTNRRSARIQPASPLEKFKHAYNLLMSRTETALLELTEHVHSSKKPLSFSIMKKILKEFSPIAINRRVRTGGTFLVDICRSRHVQESVILKCVKLLIEEHGANPNVPSAEVGQGLASSTTLTLGRRSAASSEVTCYTSSQGRELYAIVIAAARAMPSVVKYLLSCRDIDPTLKGSSRFRLFSNPRKSVKGVDLSALEFGMKMKEEEIENGVCAADLKGLNKVISLLKKAG
uniref:F-box domain-containing protein n=1 Tax=Skeletonema marinoi TaxID=267567 RepID=A0A7S2M908_9STRA|mmetsp:Transcript_5975/g.9974  ORF Transcript_5975/g.9974 Transcript_5975/m.9974 type:complete len:332 (+) Transcript_5975:78-1073(+)